MATGKSRAGECPKETDCALCVKFLSTTNYTCTGCPVMERSGQPLCNDTPYRAAYLAFQNHGIKSSIFQSEANKELMFLKLLLPKPH